MGTAGCTIGAGRASPGFGNVVVMARPHYQMSTVSVVFITEAGRPALRTGTGAEVMSTRRVGCRRPSGLPRQPRRPPCQVCQCRVIDSTRAVAVIRNSGRRDSAMNCMSPVRPTSHVPAVVLELQ